MGLLALSGLRAAVDDTIIGTVLDTLTSYPVDSVSVGAGGSRTLTKADGTFQLITSSSLALRGPQTQIAPWVVWDPAAEDFSWPGYDGEMEAEWKAGVDYPGDLVCTGPKYHHPYADNTHLTAEGYQQFGEKYGQVYFHRVILGRPWKPLMPIAVSHGGQVISVRYHVPVPPMVWDSKLQTPHAGIAAMSPKRPSRTGPSPST
jgi:hypothetical protein